MKTLTCNPADLAYKLVNYGVDTLILNVRYADSNLNAIPNSRLDDGLIEQFNSWQALAKEKEDRVPVPGLHFRETDVLIYPHGAGKGQWRWVLECPDTFKLYLGRGRLNGIVAQVRFASAYLWSSQENGKQNIWVPIIRLGDFLSDLLGGKMLHLQVSEIHLCADIAGWELTSQAASCFLSRARTRREHVEPQVIGPDDLVYSGHHLETLSFGTHASPLSVAIYDKLREIKKSGKTWLEYLWKQRGWDGKSSIWRVEFRWKREALHEIKQDGVFHGIESVYDLEHRLSYLWAYCAGHTQLGPDGLPDGWLRFTQPSEDTNAARWPIHPVWQVVQTAFCTNTEQAVDVTTGEVLDVPASPLVVLIRECQRKINVTRLSQQIDGCASTLSAWLSAPGTDEPLTLLDVFAWLRENLPSLRLPDLARLGEEIVPPELLEVEYLNQFAEIAIEKQGLYGRRSTLDL